MEEILDLYIAPASDPEPLIAMAAASTPLLAHVYPPRPPRPGRAAAAAYHYERRGGRALFMFFDPCRGWRVSSRAQRTRVDWAEEIRHLLDEEYPQAQQVRLVCDTLNTPSWRFPLCRLRPGGSAALSAAARTPLHAAHRQLAQCGGN